MPIKPLHNENELLIQASQGDEKSFAALFYAYHQPLGEFVLLLTQSPELTEEIVLDVFANLWMNRRKLAEIEKFTSYIFILSRNYTLNCIRKLANDRKHHELYAQYNQQQPEAESTTETQQNDKLLIDRAVAQLPPRQQEVFMLRMEGLKNAEIAVKLGISAQSVKKYQQWAVQFISRFVKAHAALMLLLPFF